MHVGLLGRPAAWFILAAAVLRIGLCQSPPAAATPPKPYRERLLERSLKGDAEAQFELGKNYETGRIGLPKDLPQAQHWYREAANQGEPFAAVSLGILFNFGKGVKRDDVQAFIWYERALLHLRGGDRETVIEMRDRVAAKLSSEQLAEARRAFEEWKTQPKN
jgi:TPR repeat protein